MDGEDALVGLWDMNVADNTWELRIVQTTAFKDTQFTVKLMVENPSEATNAQSWTITVKVGGVGAWQFSIDSYLGC